MAANVSITFRGEWKQEERLLDALSDKHVLHHLHHGDIDDSVGSNNFRSVNDNRLMEEEEEEEEDSTKQAGSFIAGQSFGFVVGLMIVSMLSAAYICLDRRNRRKAAARIMQADIEAAEVRVRLENLQQKQYTIEEDDGSEREMCEIPKAVPDRGGHGDRMRRVSFSSITFTEFAEV